jgi:hypothetical protein
MASETQAIFARISLSRTKKIYAFAGGEETPDGTTTILSSCSHVLGSFFSSAAATPLRKVCKEFGKTFKVPSVRPVPYAQSIDSEARWDLCITYYLKCYDYCPAEFIVAFNYMFCMRNVPSNVRLQNNFFMNDSTFRDILANIFKALSSNPFAFAFSSPDEETMSRMHFMVLRIGDASLGINPYSRTLCSEWWEREKTNIVNTRRLKIKN